MSKVSEASSFLNHLKPIVSAITRHVKLTISFEIIHNASVAFYWINSTNTREYSREKSSRQSHVYGEVKCERERGNVSVIDTRHPQVDEIPVTFQTVTISFRLGRGVLRNWTRPDASLAAFA